MHTITIVRCSNCGSYAEKHDIAKNNIIRTSCPSCDYLMVQCSVTGKVIEAYAPGINGSQLLASRDQ